MIRNLICHIYPRKVGNLRRPTPLGYEYDGGHWRATVERLRASWDQFEGGRKVVTVATDETTEDVHEVYKAFMDTCMGGPFNEIDWIVRPNNPALQETEFLGESLRLIIDAPGITLRCHGKGSTHGAADAASHLWREAMFDVCLDYPRLVDCALQRFPVAGAFRSNLGFGPAGAWNPPWHFAGSFYWFDNAALRARQWRRIEPTYWGVESYPGVQFSLEESACLFWTGAATAHLYDPSHWQKYILPALAKWREKVESILAKPSATADGDCNRRASIPELAQNRIDLVG